jgi:hypothetical protein
MRLSPIHASSGKTERHRLNHGADRQAKSAMHMITVVRLRHCTRTLAYLARRTADGKTKREVVRCLKRYIAREVYRTLTADLKDLSATTLTIYRNVPVLDKALKILRVTVKERRPNRSSPTGQMNGWKSILKTLARPTATA